MRQEAMRVIQDMTETGLSVRSDELAAARRALARAEAQLSPGARVKAHTLLLRPFEIFYQHARGITPGEFEISYQHTIK